MIRPTDPCQGSGPKPPQQPSSGYKLSQTFHPAFHQQRSHRMFDRYVVSFRWDCEQTKQIWSSCGDVTIKASGMGTKPFASQRVHAVGSLWINPHGSTLMPCPRKDNITGLSTHCPSRPSNHSSFPPSTSLFIHLSVRIHPSIRPPAGH